MWDDLRPLRTILDLGMKSLNLGTSMSPINNACDVYNNAWAYLVFCSLGCLPIPSRDIEFPVLKYVMRNLMCVAEENLLRALQRFHTEASIAEQLLVSPEIQTEPRPWSPTDFAFVIGDHITETVENFRTL